ncbi:MAG: hypothetical protein CL840_16380 [Crocinitomicaceae bacterium]|nr:hypothetical protein [Crocinitomicaceae bacterium]|tara:strand:+ start:5208 stop:5714 length:507 start_codon:yes stop_codon:yes gene_type:complete
MKYSKGIISLFFLLGAFTISAQSLERSVVSSGGQEQKNASLNLSFTVGESAITTSKQSTLIITQGFQQSYEEEGGDTNISVENQIVDLGISLFPNPSHQFVNITSTSGKELTLTVVDGLGKVILQQKISFKNQSEISIPVSAWAVGQYYFRLMEEGSEMLSNYKVVKR